MVSSGTGRASACLDSPFMRTRIDPRVYRTPLVILITSLLVTGVTSFVLHRMAAARDLAMFQNAVESTADRLVGRLDTYISLLRGGASLFAASRDVTRQEFHDYVIHLGVQRLYPGIQGIGYAARLDSAERVRMVQAARAGGIEEFHVWPDTARTDWFPIVFLEPLDARNRAALGFDMYTEPRRREAMARARDTGQPAMTGRLTLVQEITAEKQAGFLVYVPVYGGTTPPRTVEERRARLIGFVYAPFRADDLFRGIFGTEREPRVRFKVFEGRAADSTGLLHDSWRVLRGDQRRPEARFRDTTFLRVGGVQWTITYASEQALEEGSTRYVPAAVALGGVLLSFVLYWLALAEAKARRRAEESEAARTRFYAAMSHELRTPINAILGYNDLILAGVYGPITAEQQQGLERGQVAARHLLELVNDVLDLSKIEAGKMEARFETVRVPELLEDLATTMRPLAASHGSTLEIESAPGLPVIRSDPRRLRQILLNLLSNATKFGEGKPVSVRARLDGDDLCISVQDHGIGIPPHLHGRVFEEFVQLPNSKTGGTGLGLPISRRLAKLLGGSLELTKSRPGAGTTFVLRLPTRVDATGRASAPA